MKTSLKIVVNIFFLLFFQLSLTINAQNLSLPRISPAAEITQSIGLSKVKITYSRPKVNERVIWGGLVPYNSIWRAGANENSTITFSDDAKINGTPIPAGKYGFHIIPKEEEWTLIFSRHNNSWGSFFYDKKADQLRINVKPKQNDFEEFLTYGFDNLTKNSTSAFLAWENIRIEFIIEFDNISITLESIREQLRSIPGFGWQGPKQGAEYCLQHNINLDEALEWIDVSINRFEMFDNLYTKVLILNALNKTEDIKEVSDNMKKYIDSINEYQLNNLAYTYYLQKEYNQAIELYRDIIEDNPSSWQSLDGIGDVYLAKNERKQAEKYYNKALEFAPDNVKDSIRGKILNK